MTTNDGIREDRDLESSSWVSLGRREKERETPLGWLLISLDRGGLAADADCRRRWRPAATQVNVVTSTGDAFEDDGEQKERKKMERERERF